MPLGAWMSGCVFWRPPLYGCTLTRNTWLSIWAGCSTVCMHDSATEQPAPTIHQSLIWNNSIADSAHKITPLPKQMISLQDNSSDLGLVPRSHPQLAHLFNPGLTITPSVCMCVWVGACLSQLLLFLSCVSLGADWQGVSMAEKKEALMSSKRLW